MHFSSLLFTASVCLGAAIEPRQSDTACKNPSKRVEWRLLPKADQKLYQNSVLCLTTKPSRLGLNSTLYDDFPFVHAQLNNESQFVPVPLI